MEKHLDISGYSGCRFKINKNGNFVKYARGCEERIDNLRASYLKTIAAYNNDSMNPIKVAQPISFTASKETFSFEMEHIVTNKEFSVECDDIFKREVISYFSKEHLRTSGFKEKCYSELVRLKGLSKGDGENNTMFNEVHKLIEECDDFYLESFCHGDFGYNNFLVSNNKLYAIDITPSFINSILVDVATFQMNALEAEGTIKEVFNTIYGFYKEYEKQIALLRKLRVLSFWRNTNTESTKVFHRKLFHAE